MPGRSISRRRLPTIFLREFLTVEDRGAQGQAVPAANGPLMTVIRVVTLLLLAGFLLFAHGCHGDEDNELFAHLVELTSAGGP